MAPRRRPPIKEKFYEGFKIEIKIIKECKIDFKKQLKLSKNKNVQ